MKTIESLATSIVKRLRKAGFEAYFAGGAVRDRLLRRKSQDIDIATNATPQSVRSLFEKTFAVGEQFGVVIVVLDGHNFEVTTFRKDYEYLDGRHPQKVVFSTAKEDAHRRDFTINGLFYDPLSKEVIDYVGGQKDLQARRLRAIGKPEERFAEDKLRMLRAVRFAARFQCRIEAKTLKAIKHCAGDIHQVSRERIRDELLKMLGSMHRLQAMRLLRTSTLAEQLFEGSLLKPKSWSIALDIVQALPKRTEPLVALAALLDVLGVASAMAFAQTLKLSRKDLRFVEQLFQAQERIAQAKTLSEAQLKRLLASPIIDSELQLFKARAKALGFSQGPYTFCRKTLKQYSPKELKPKALIGGEDLIAWGLKPSKMFQNILDWAYDMQLEGKARSKAALKKLLQKSTSPLASAEPSSAVAVIDIGSNTMHLDVFDLTGYQKGKDLPVLCQHSDLCRLGEYLHGDKRLPKAVIKRSVQSLQRMVKQAKDHGATSVHIFATSILREASNAKEFIDLCLKRTGITIDVLSVKQEGRLAYEAVNHLCDVRKKNIVVLDIGGGSSEHIWVDKGEVRFNGSVAQGFAKLKQRGGFGTESFTQKDVQKAIQLSERLVKRLIGPIDLKGLQDFYVTSSVLKLIAHTEYPDCTLWQLAQKPVSLKILRKWHKEVLRNPQNPQIVQDKKDLLFMGTIFFEILLNSLPVKHLKICPWSIRQPYILKKISV